MVGHRRESQRFKAEEGFNVLSVDCRWRGPCGKECGASRSRVGPPAPSQHGRETSVAQPQELKSANNSELDSGHYPRAPDKNSAQLTP